MKRLFLVLLILAVIATNAWAKITPVRIVIGIDEPFIPFVTVFKINVKTDPAGPFTHVGTIDNLATQNWILTDIDIPPGQVVWFGVDAEYEPASPGDDPIVESSADFPWKSTGKPFIISVQRAK